MCCVCKIVLVGWSGKTLAFGIPAIMHVLSKRKSKTSKKVNPLCLVLSPTRELAQQVCSRFVDYRLML